DELDGLQRFVLGDLAADLGDFFDPGVIADGLARGGLAVEGVGAGVDVGEFAEDAAIEDVAGAVVGGLVFLGEGVGFLQQAVDDGAVEVGGRIGNFNAGVDGVRLDYVLAVGGGAAADFGAHGDDGQHGGDAQ